MFLTVAATIAVVVGLVALVAPDAMLAMKGVAGDTAATVWMRQVGVLLLATGVTAALVRRHPDSPTLRAVLVGNALLQLGLLPIEPLAYAQGVIPNLAGIVPNTVVHIVLAAGFVVHARAVRTTV